jgi:hypothetical protein
VNHAQHRAPSTGPTARARRPRHLASTLRVAVGALLLALVSGVALSGTAQAASPAPAVVTAAAGPGAGTPSSTVPPAFLDHDLPKPVKLAQEPTDHACWVPYHHGSET